MSFFDWCERTEQRYIAWLKGPKNGFRLLCLLVGLLFITQGVFHGCVYR